MRFLAHYLEMVVAMVVGMAALAPLWDLAFPGLQAHPDLMVATMVLDMSVAMAGWMLVRGNPRPHVVRMTATMPLGFVVVLPAYWAGALDAAAMESLGHGLMLVVMLLVMLVPSRHAAGSAS